MDLSDLEMKIIDTNKNIVDTSGHVKKADYNAEISEI